MDNEVGPSKERVFMTMANIGRAVVLAQTAECLLNYLMSTHDDIKLLKKTTVEEFAKMSRPERKRTLGQLFQAMKELFESDKRDSLENSVDDFVVNRNDLIHRLTNQYGAKLDTNEGLETADALALEVMESSCICIVGFFRGIRLIADKHQGRADQHGIDADTKPIKESIDQLFRSTVHPVIDPDLQKLFESLGFNWKDPKNDGGFRPSGG